MSHIEQGCSVLDKGPLNRVTFQDCNSSVDENLIRTPHNSNILLSSPYGAEAPITEEMTRDFNHFTRTSTEPPQHIKGLYNSSSKNIPSPILHSRTMDFFKVRLEPLTSRCQPLHLVALFGQVHDMVIDGPQLTK